MEARMIRNAVILLARLPALGTVSFRRTRPAS
jgi:hypothetical protein